MIRKATTEDLPEILRIYAAARAYMKATGNPNQWGDHHPAQALLEEDIRLGRLYVEEDGGLHGVFALLFGEDATYAVIEDGAWCNDLPYATIPVSYTHLVVLFRANRSLRENLAITGLLFAVSAAAGVLLSFFF